MSSRKTSFSREGLPSSRSEERTPLRSLENEMMRPSTISSKFKSNSLLIADVSMTKGDIPFTDPEPNSQCSPCKKVIQTSISMINTEMPCGLGDVTFKSFICPGGEVEITDSSLHAEESIIWKSFVPDVTRLRNETIPLPEQQLAELKQDSSVNTTNISAVECKVEHADHPYCSSEKDVSVHAAFSENSNGLEEPADAVCDVTFKSFNCTGGEIQISDGTALVDDTFPLPADQAAALRESQSYGIDPSMSAIEDVQNNDEHLEHPYCDNKCYSSTLHGNLAVFQESLPIIKIDAVDEDKHVSLLLPIAQTSNQECVKLASLISSGIEVEESDATQLSRKTFPLPDDQAVISPVLHCNSAHPSIIKEQIQENLSEPNSEVLGDSDLPAISTPSLTNSSLKALVDSEMQDNSKKDPALPLLMPRTEPSASIHLVASVENPTPVEQHQECISQDHLNSEPHQSSDAKDSAIGSSGNGPGLCNSAEKPQTENLSGALKVLSECPSVATALEFGVINPVVRRASLLLSENTKHPADKILSDDSALEVDRSLLSHVNVNPAGLWAEHMESPMPCPLFNSTTLGCRYRPDTVTEPVEDVVVKPSDGLQTEVKPVVDTPLISDGPLQQQLRQMAEFLFLASGKINAAPASAPLQPPTVFTAPLARATPVRSHSICVGTTPMKWAECGINTSGQFERKRDFSVTDSCTLTDPLLWNVPPGSLECLPRQELEQRLMSSMIMVEALVQQLATARTHGCPAGPAPSDLREKLVQTDHTELNQTTLHRDLYLEALRRIGELELDESSLQDLVICIQDLRVSMTSLTCDTDAVLSNMKEIEGVVKDDHHSLVTHYGQMKSLFEKTKQTHRAIMQKVKDALQQRDDMKVQMEEAFTAKEAAFSVMEQLRTHCANEISELESILGSQQELSAALNQTHPELVALNHAYNETMNSASDVLSATIKEQSSLMEELYTVRGLLQRTAPMLLQLNEKAAAALEERDDCMSARDQAVKDREQMQEEWNQTNLNLQAAREQIGDLNLQVTILTSEMGVLRQKLKEREEERGQLDRKVTELSATVSSTLASYAFLEQALAAETTKLQQSWKDIQEAKDRATQLETSLARSEQSVCELSQALNQREDQLSQLRTLSQSQSAEIQQLRDVCTQLSGVREMNEFLQMENELAREQMAESERMLRANLQGLRERNIECEDLKGELTRLQLENRSLQEVLETTRSRADAAQLEHRESLAQAGTEITLLHHTLRGLTNELHAALHEQKTESSKDKESEAFLNTGRRHPSSSFVDSVMVALTAEEEEYVNRENSPVPAVSSDVPESQTGTLFSKTSAFTRIAAVTPKKQLNAVEIQPEEDEQSSLPELFTGLDGTVTELISTLKLVQQCKDAELAELRTTVCGLQVEQEAANNRHQAEVFELQHQLSRLNNLVERGSQVLQQKAQDDKTITKLMSEIQETQEILNKLKTESNEQRKEVVELRRSLQQSQVESEVLRGELRKACGQSAPPAHFMEEKIKLLKEVERLKSSLQEVEQARVKLLDRAKRHQIIHQTNQQKSENELQLLNSMINKVRETLLSLPDVLKDSEPLQQLVEYIG